MPTTTKDQLAETGSEQSVYTVRDFDLGAGDKQPSLDLEALRAQFSQLKGNICTEDLKLLASRGS